MVTLAVPSLSFCIEKQQFSYLNVSDIFYINNGNYLGFMFGVFGGVAFSQQP